MPDQMPTALLRNRVCVFLLCRKNNQFSSKCFEGNLRTPSSATLLCWRRKAIKNVPRFFGRRREDFSAAWKVWLSSCGPNLTYLLPVSAKRTSRRSGFHVFTQRLGTGEIRGTV